MKPLFVREVFNTLQGEGARAGARSVFVRLAGCNLWDGIPEHRNRGEGACARWCDTDFAKGTKTELDELLKAMDALWPQTGLRHHEEQRWCVITGGEPLLQLTHEHTRAIALAGWNIAVETNGTVKSDALTAVHWVTCSPKLSTLPLVDMFVQEVKVILPGAVLTEGWTADMLRNLERKYHQATRFYVQPMDPPAYGDHPVPTGHTYLHKGGVGEDTYRATVQQCIDFVQANPRWRLSMQMHKYAKLP